MTPDSSIAAYLRLSREEEREKHVSMEEKINLRREILLTIARHHNLTLTAEQVVVELKSGGSLTERYELLHILDKCRRREIHTLVVFDIDRLTRDVVDLKTICNALFKGEVRLITQRGVYQFDAHFDTTLIQILAVLGEKERRSFSYRRKAANEQRARNGKLSQGYAPYGYRWNKERDCYEIHAEEYAVVEEIFSLIRSMGCYSVAQELDRRGVVAPGLHKREGANKNWLKGTIGSIVRNPFYTGRTVKRRDVDREGVPVYLPPSRWVWSEEPLVTITEEGESFPLPHPVTIEEWRDLQDVVSERRHALPSRGLLTGLLVCSQNQPMHRHYRYYSCTCAASHTPHRLHTITRHLVESAVWNVVAEYVQSLPPLKPPKKSVLDQSARLELERRSVERELREKRETIEELVSRASFYRRLPHYGATDKSGLSLYDRTLETLGTDISKLEARLSSVKEKQSRPEARLANPFLRQLASGGLDLFLENADDETKRDLLHTLIERVQPSPQPPNRQQIVGVNVTFCATGEPVTLYAPIPHARLGKPRGTYKRPD